MQSEERQHRHARPRLETLSDLIYGLSLSIGAISLVITNSTQSNAIDIDRNILEFLFVFLILITSWIIYTSDMSVLPMETRLVTLLNVILLILVAIIPYLFDQAVSLINTPDVQNYASILFTFDYSGSLFIMAGFAHLIAQEEEQLAHNDQMIRFRRIRNRLTILTFIVLFSTAVPWEWLILGVHIRLLIGLVPIASFWFNRMRYAPMPHMPKSAQNHTPGETGSRSVWIRPPASRKNEDAHIKLRKNSKVTLAQPHLASVGSGVSLSSNSMPRTP